MVLSKRKLYRIWRLRSAHPFAAKVVQDGSYDDKIALPHKFPNESTAQLAITATAGSDPGVVRYRFLLDFGYFKVTRVLLLEVLEAAPE
mmetsp:Transcript_37361/g.116814  ORF Transcript_37361/g.116814 Transcript_37361/m.116814 type:complete len:89 (-) Transcript_37361:450-716(-)